MPKIEFVRVFVPESNSDVTVPRSMATSRGLKIIDKPAVNRYGKPLPPKPHQPLGTPKSSPAQKGGAKADEAASASEATKEAK